MKSPEISKLRCPFCNQPIEKPKEFKEKKPIEFPLGSCEKCGAVYAFDATGHNRGAAFVDALLLACNNDDYMAFSLSADEDYSDAVIEKYDLMSHRVAPEGRLDDRYIRGALIFVKLNKEFQGVTKDKIKEKMRTAIQQSKQKYRSDKFSKGIVHTYIRENNIKDLIALARADSRVIYELQRMLLTPDELLRWQIINLIAEVSYHVVEQQLDTINKFLYRLLLSAKDSAASAWGALEASGAIISANPDFFGEYSQSLLSFLQTQNLWKEVTWAIGRIATRDPYLVRHAYPALCLFLGNPDPTLRGYAAWALGELKLPDAIKELGKLEADSHILSIYKDGELKKTTVSQLVKEAIEKLNKCTRRV
jgi:hypothetical protein